MIHALLKLGDNKQLALLGVRKFTAQPEVKIQNEWDNAKPFEEIPSLSRLQVIRRFSPGGKYFDRPLAVIYNSMREEFGDIVVIPAMFGKPQFTTIFNIVDIEKLFRFEGQFPYRRSLETLTHYRKNIRPDIYHESGDLISEQGEKWYKMRSIVNPVFMKPNNIKLYTSQVDVIAKDFINLIMNKRDKKGEVPANFSHFMSMFTLESIACITINCRLGLLDDGNRVNENAENLIKYISDFQDQFYDFEVEVSVWRVYETKAFKELMKTCDKFTNIVMRYVEEAIGSMESKPVKPGQEESILDKLIKVNKNCAVVMCADALLAGIHTTAAALLAVLYCLAKNQDKQDKLREELRRVLPDKNDGLTPDKMRNMPYLRAVIKEGFRIYPTTTGSMRRPVKDVVLAGYRIPEGTDIIMGLSLSHTDESQFKQAEKFIPERWIKTKSDECLHLKDHHPFAFIPFSFGPRMCVGRRLAELEMEIVLTRIIRDYRVEWNHFEDMKIRSKMVNYPTGDLKFKFSEV